MIPRFRNDGIPYAAWAWICLLLLGACVNEPTRLAGGWSDTETGQKVAGRIMRADGRPAAGALIQLRPEQYLVASLTPDDTAGVSASGGSIVDGVCDSTGRFRLDSVDAGRYVLESRYKEINAIAIRFEMRAGKGRMDLTPAAVKPAGTITGRVRFSNDDPGPAAVRIRALERIAFANPRTGVFTFGDVPEGTYSLHFSGLEPFVSPEEKQDIRVAAGSGINIGETVLQRGLKQSFVIQDGFLEIPGVDSTNPVIFENGAFHRPIDGAYLWAKASMGHLDLRGTIVSYAKDTGEAALNVNVQNCMNMIDLARLSGMRSMPDPVPGAKRKLPKPKSGRIEDLVSESSQGSLLLIREARKASPGKPLVLICGSNLTTVAQALLADPSIADRIVVFGANNGNYNIDDSLALAVVAKKARFVEWARDYVWPTIGVPTVDSVRFPHNRIGDLMKSQFASVAASPGWAFSSFGDFGPATFLFKRKVWKSAQSANILSAPLNAAISAPAPYDFVDIPMQANDWGAIEDELFATINDPNALHSWVVPGTLEAEAYQGTLKVLLDTSKSDQSQALTWQATGAWAEYPIQADSTGDYMIDLRYTCDSTSQVKVTDTASDESAILDLPTGYAWAQATGIIRLKQGKSTLRVESAGGAFKLNWLRLR
jgi:hypothetical protein